MKKLISLLGTVILAGTPAITLVSCNQNNSTGGLHDGAQDLSKINNQIVDVNSRIMCSNKKPTSWANWWTM